MLLKLYCLNAGEVTNISHTHTHTHTDWELPGIIRALFDCPVTTVRASKIDRTFYDCITTTSTHSHSHTHSHTHIRTHTQLALAAVFEF